MFTKHKVVIGFCFGTKGEVQATSKVTCQLMSFMSTFFFNIPYFNPYNLISKPNVTYGTAMPNRAHLGILGIFLKNYISRY